MRPTKRRLLELGSVLALCLLGAIVYSPAQAQTAPADCKPNAGATSECTAETLPPYVYLNASCGSPPYSQSASAAESIWDSELGSIYTSCPGSSLTGIGWPSASSPMCLGGGCGAGYTPFTAACEGGPSKSPTMSLSGVETKNWLVFQTGGNQGPPSCTPRAPYFLAKVRRDRTIGCPQGYNWTGYYCYRLAIDPAKNLGKQCPTCGNPITPGTGNKFQQEVDYRGSGSYPLTFIRYYNSQQRVNNRDQGYYSYTNFFDRFGNDAWPSIGSQQGRTGYSLPAGQERRDALKWTNLALDSIGANWRHNYQRSIFYQLSNSSGVSSATAFREDGRVLAFVHHNGAFYPAEDIADRLTGSPSTGWTYISAATEETESYDADGRLLSIKSRAGITHTLQYDADGRLASVSDDFGNTITFGYSLAAGDPNAVQRITTVTVPGGGIYQYGYGTNSTLTSVTYPNSTSRQYQYTGPTPRALTAVLDENGATFATWTYDAYGQATSSAHAGGAEQVAVAYTKTSLIQTGTATLTDAAGAVRTYSYLNVHGVPKVSSVAKPAASGTGTVTEYYSYDANGNLKRKADFNGNSTCYVYDTARNLETVRVEGFAPSVGSCPANLETYTPTAGTRQRKIVTAWNASYRLPTSITEANRTTSFTYDANGNVLTRTVTDTNATPNVARTWTYTYNGFGQVLSADGPRTDVTDLTTYTYYTCTSGYQCGQLNTITNAAGHVTTYNSYNAHGQPTQITDPNGLVTALGYDARQRLTDRCVGAALPGCAGGELTHLDYWPTGLLKKVTNPDASYIQYTYDNAHRLTQINDGASNKIVYTLDAMDNRTAENTYDPSNALKRTHSRVFNTLNQLWKDVNAAGTTNVTTVFGYDNNGNQTTTNAPLSRNSTSLYDELNRLKQITDPASGVTQFGYDVNDNLASVTDPRSLVTSYTYTGFGDLKTQTSPDTGLTTNAYDSGGNLSTSTDARSAITTYTYDAMSRVSTAAYKIGSTADQTFTYTYDGGTNQKGRLTGASDGSNPLSWSYDAQGRITSKTQSFSGVTATLSVGYGYNAQGQLFHVVLPSGKAITYGYNSNGQVSSVTLDGAPGTTILNNISYDPFGPITGWTWGNGTSTSGRSFDTDGELTALSSTASAVGNRTFGYDDAFRITSTTDSVSGGPGWTLGYDSLDRLNSASSSGTTIGYTYDANGNRLSQTGTSASTYTVSGTSNRLSSTSGALVRSYTYSNSGSVLATGVTTHTYYNSGRMQTAKLGAAAVTTYSYNGLGQRIEKAGGAISTAVYFLYDEAGHLLGEYNISGGTLTTVQETVWLGDIPVATLRAGSGSAGVFYVYTDQLNSPRKVTDTSDQLRWKWDPTPFGEGAPSENPQSLGAFAYNLRFPGQYFDVESGLNYNYYRDYDTATGRYVESDPLGLRGGIGTFAYAAGSPVESTDRFGLIDITAVEERWRQATPDRPDASGETLGYIENTHCSCEGAGNCWKLVGCTASVLIDVRLNPDVTWPSAVRKAKEFEQEHVDDYREGIKYIQDVGGWREDEERKLSFSSKKACEDHATSAVDTSLKKAMETVKQNTIAKRDTTDGGHQLRWYHYH